MHGLRLNKRRILYPSAMNIEIFFDDYLF